MKAGFGTRGSRDADSLQSHLSILCLYFRLVEIITRNTTAPNTRWERTSRTHTTRRGLRCDIIWLSSTSVATPRKATTHRLDRRRPQEMRQLDDRFAAGALACLAELRTACNFGDVVDPALIRNRPDANLRLICMGGCHDRGNDVQRKTVRCVQPKGLTQAVPATKSELKGLQTCATPNSQALNPADEVKALVRELGSLGLDPASGFGSGLRALLRTPRLPGSFRLRCVCPRHFGPSHSRSAPAWSAPRG